LHDLLFFTDNRNQPRKINVELANPTSSTLPDHYVREDQISVAKYYPYETPLVLTKIFKRVTAGTDLFSGTGDPTSNNYVYGYRITMVSTSNIETGDIVTGFPGQGAQELWTVFRIDSATQLTIYNNFYRVPGTYNGTDTVDIYFSRSPVGLVSAGDNLTIDYSYSPPLATSTEETPSPTPKVGDLFTSSDLGITIADDIRIMAVNQISLGIRAEITLNKDITTVTGTESITIGLNPDYDANFTGDADLLEQRFVRFSYRFRFEDNEYSLSAPFTQICFIPKQYGQIGYGRSSGTVDMLNIYDSTVVEWFENRIDSIVLKVPLPDGGDTATTALASLSNDYKVKSIDILYKESDALITNK
jgi:hypothetical protein